MVKVCKFLSFGAALTLCLPAMAQSTTGTIGGRVVDPQGAVVPGAAVTVTSTTTDVAHAVTTNQDGLYTVPLLLPGSYTVSVVTPSFKKEIQNNVTLQIAQVIALDFKLSVGANTETVTVTSSAQIIQTQSAAIGTVIDTQKILEIPLNGRQYYSLAELAPGVMPPVQGSSLSYRGGINVAGQQETSNYATLDGIDNIDTAITGPAVVPSVEDIQEFKIYSGEYEAEFGHHIGGQLIVTTKSGGNAFHGDIYEFLRNQLFDAKNYFTPANEKLSLHRNNYGGTLGGPIIPSKMFFFFSGEILQLRNQYVAKVTVPTTAQISGNFAGAAPLNVPAGYNPDVIDTTNNSIDVGNLTTAELQAYTVGQALLAFYPVDTTPGGNNYTYSAANSENLEVYGLRIDNTLNAKNTTYATLNYFNNPEITSNGAGCAPPSLPGFLCINGATDQIYGGGWTHIFTPNLINNFVAGYLRSVVPRYAENATIPFDTTYGIPAYTLSSGSFPIPFQGPPATTITGYQSFGNNPGPQARRDNSFDYNDTVLWNKGDHSFKSGFEYTRTLDTVFYSGSLVGAFNFNGIYTGNPVADAVLGLPVEASRAPIQGNYENYFVHGKQSYLAGFVEDSWKILPNLTMNYGLRWEAITPWTSGNDNTGSFDVATGETFIGCEDGQPCHVWHGDNDGWGPRLGLSYRPFKNDRTVIQAGAAINYEQFFSLGSLLSLQIGYPIRQAQTFNGTVSAPLSLPNPFTGNGATALNPNGISPNFPNTRNVGYTLGVEQQLSLHTVLTLTYQGSETAHIENSYNINQAKPQLTAALGNASRPYPQWNTIAYETAYVHANYNALYAKLQQSLSHGLTYLISYTWGKSMDDNGTPQNIYNLRAERGLSNFDVRNRFVASPVYQLPWGAGREYLNHGWVSEIIGDWEVAGEIALQNGTPVTPKDGSNVSNNGETSGDRPYVQGNPNSGPHTLTEWFNVFDYNYQNVVAGGATAPNQNNSFPGTTVVPPTPEPYGNARNESIQGPSYKDVDVNIERDFVLPRKMSLQFRAELFNAFNHPIFGLPGSTFTGFTKNATTGVISAAGSFGHITSAEDGRDVEFALKLFY